MVEQTTTQTDQTTTSQGNTDTSATDTTSQQDSTLTFDKSAQSQTEAKTSDSTTTEALSWLSDEYRTNEAFKDLSDANALAKAHLDLKAANDELTKAKTELEGKLPKVPENPDGYDVKIPDGLPVDKDFVSAMQATAHAAGIGKDQFDAFAQKYMDIQKAFMDHIKSEQDTAVNALKIEWGAKYDENVTVAQQAFKKFAPSDDESKYLKTTGLGNDPVLVRIFERIGRAMSEDTFPLGDGGVAEGKQTTPDGKPMLTFSKSFPKR